MKALLVTNLYPPHHHGGYELRCAQVAEHLVRAGHRVQVVTSRYEAGTQRHGAVVRDETHNGVPVSRFLRHHRLDPSPPRGGIDNLDVVRQQIRDLTRFGQILDDFSPDVVSWWNLEGLTKAILRMSGDRAIPNVYCIDDGWMINEFGANGDVDLPFWCDFWRVNWGPRLVRPVVRRSLRPLEHRLAARRIPTQAFRVPPGDVCFISEFWRALHQRAGLDVSASHVIYGGVAPEVFLARRSPADYAEGPLRLLYAGYLNRSRGLHTIIEALGLMSPAQRARMHLSIAYGGPVVQDEYVEGIHARIAELALSGHVTFLGRVPHVDMPAVYAAQHALVFASMRNEGMPMVMMEAMCAGCAVPNTGSGGSIELAERAGTPLFPKDHPFALSRLLIALEQNRASLAEIALRGQQTVLREFTIDRMLKATEAVLARCAAQGAVTESRIQAAV